MVQIKGTLKYICREEGDKVVTTFRDLDIIDGFASEVKGLVEPYVQVTSQSSIIEDPKLESEWVIEIDEGNDGGLELTKLYYKDDARIYVAYFTDGEQTIEYGGHDDFIKELVYGKRYDITVKSFTK